MADKPTVQDSTKPVDLDEIEVEILIIARNASVLNQAAQFLSRRGWPTVVHDNISRSIEYIADKKPDFVFLSLNHPSPGIARLPDLIVQTFNLTCIGFVEIMDSASSQKLNASKMRLKLQGQPSGPNLQRFIRKALAERFGVNEAAAEHEPSSTSKQSDGPGSFTIKGSSAKDSGPTLIQKSAGSNFEWNNKTSQNSDGKSEGETESNMIMMMDSEADPKKPPTKKKKSLKELAGVAPTNVSGNLLNGEETDGASKNPEAEKLSATEAAARLKQSVLSEGDTGASDLTEAEAAAEAARAARAARAAANMQFTTGSNSSEKSATEEGGSTDSPSFSFDIGNPSKMNSATQSGTNSPEVTYQGATPKEAPTYDSAIAVPFRKKPEDEGHTSLLARAVETGIRNVCVFPKTEHYDDLSGIQEVGIFPIDSAVVSGYLVIGWKGDEALEREFLQKAESAIRGSFADLQVAATIEAGFTAKIPPIHFRDWMNEKSTFGFSVLHRTAEMGIAFVALGRPLPKARASETGDMYCIDVGDMATNQPVNFHVYLHLEKNNKYYLYLREGRKLQSEQKERLTESKVKDFFMKSGDVKHVRKFFASSHVVESILDFLKKAS